MIYFDVNMVMADFIYSFSKGIKSRSFEFSTNRSKNLSISILADTLLKDKKKRSDLFDCACAPHIHFFKPRSTFEIEYLCSYLNC